MDLVAMGQKAHVSADSGVGVTLDELMALPGIPLDELMALPGMEGIRMPDAIAKDRGFGESQWTWFVGLPDESGEYAHVVLWSWLSEEEEEEEPDPDFREWSVSHWAIGSSEPSWERVFPASREAIRGLRRLLGVGVFSTPPPRSFAQRMCARRASRGKGKGAHARFRGQTQNP